MFPMTMVSVIYFFLPIVFSILSSCSFSSSINSMCFLLFLVLFQNLTPYHHSSSSFKMDPVYFSSLIQFVFILPALLSQADSSLDNHPGASREQTVDSSQFPITNPMNALRHGTGPYRSGGGSSLPHELRIEPDKILKVRYRLNFGYDICDKFGKSCMPLDPCSFDRIEEPENGRYEIHPFRSKS